MDTYLVAYDICAPKRLRKVAQTCEDFGIRRQYSVFLCRLSAADLVRLKGRLYDIINLDEDQVLLIPLCARCAGAIEALGRPFEKHDARDVVIVTRAFPYLNAWHVGPYLGAGRLRFLRFQVSWQALGAGRPFRR